MSNIDDKIRKALSEEDRKTMDEIINDEAGLFELIGMSLKGKKAWIVYYMYFLGFATFFAAIYFLTQYLAATDIESSLDWALAIITCLFMFALVKLVGWQQIIKMELMREIKRLEVRLLTVAEKRDSEV